MPTPNLDWNALRFVLALARQGSLDGAATALRVDPSTVSRRIRALEGVVGARIFDRSSAGHRLTSVGNAILQTAEEVEAGIAAMKRHAGHADSRLEGTIRIATGDVVACRLIPLLARFRREYPAVVFEMVADLHPGRLVRHEADVAILAKRPTQVHLASRRIATFGFGLYGSQEYLQDHPFRRGDPLAGHQLLGYHESLDEIPEARWLARHLGETSELAVRVSSLDPLLGAAASGLGLAVLPCCLADGHSRLVRLLGPEDVLLQDLWLVVHRDSRGIARLRLLNEYLATEFREWAPVLLNGGVQATG